MTEPLLTLQTKKPLEFIWSSSSFWSSVDIEVKIAGSHPALGFNFKQEKDNAVTNLQHSSPSSPTYRILYWKSTLRKIISVVSNGSIINNMESITYIISTSQQSFNKTVTFTLIPPECVNIHLNNNARQINFDQMNIMAYQHQAAINKAPEWNSLHRSPPITDDIIFACINRG